MEADWPETAGEWTIHDCVDAGSPPREVNVLADLAVSLVWHADALVLQVVGVLDITTVQRFAAQLAEILAVHSPRLLVFDLCALDLLAAAGFRALIDVVGGCDRRSIRTAVACDPSSIVYRVVQILRIHEHVPVYTTARDAVAALS
jgi:anti-anti-sigma factor